MEENPRKLRKLAEEPLASHVSTALAFRLWHECGRARRGTLTLPHGTVETPTFMPVGTHGSMKMVPSEVLETLGPTLILGNTYHLGSAPGVSILRKAGTLHNFMAWKRNLLTDSGGFQMVSLSSLSEVREEGVEFRHPETNEELLLTPEKSIEIQNAIGADVMMALDDVVSVVEPSEERLTLAVERTTRWLNRCLTAHVRRETQNLWPIIQGALNPKLRLQSLKSLIACDAPGYAIGGLSGGEAKSDFWKIVEQCTRPDGGLPRNKSRYLMGVGYCLDILVCVALGCDLFDCVYPTRTARFGTALSDEGLLRLRKSVYATDVSPIDSNCDCTTCKNCTRAFLHYGMNQPSTLALISTHNLRYMDRFMYRIRRAIEAKTFPSLVRELILKQFPNTAPCWVRDALVAAGIDAAEWVPWDESASFLCGQMPHHIAHKAKNK